MRLSEALLGDPTEIETAEAEELLKGAGLDPDVLKASLYRRMRERSGTYTAAGRPVPPLIEKALEDLRPPAAERDREDKPEFRMARLAIQQLLREIRELPQRLGAGFVPAFTAAYRNRTELSDRDQKTLDKIAEVLRNKSHE